MLCKLKVGRQKSALALPQRHTVFTEYNIVNKNLQPGFNVSYNHSLSEPASLSLKKEALQPHRVTVSIRDDPGVMVGDVPGNTSQDENIISWKFFKHPSPTELDLAAWPCRV